MFAEGTRVATTLVIIDLPRPPTPLHLLRLATMLPWAPFVPFVHDGVISSLRCYSPSALRALAAHAHPTSSSPCAAASPPHRSWWRTGLNRDAQNPGPPPAGTAR